MLVTIITPALNSDKYIEETINSVMNQPYKNIEHIIVDGGSEDKTLSIIKKYPHLKLIQRIADNGMYDAINIGILASKGDIIACLNSDDIYYNNTINIVIEYFHNHHNADLIFGDINIIDRKSRTIGRYRYPKFNPKLLASINWCLIPQPASFWRRKIHDTIGYFDINFKLAGDYDFFLRVSQKCKVDHVNNLRSGFRVHDKSLSSTKSDLNIKELAIIRNLKHTDLDRFENKFILYIITTLLKINNVSFYFQKMIYWMRIRLESCS